MKKRVWILLLALVAAASLFLAACAKKETADNRVPPAYPPEAESVGGAGAKSLTLDESGLLAYGTGIESLEYAEDIPAMYSELDNYAFPEKGVKITAANAGAEVYTSSIVDLNKLSGPVVTFEVLADDVYDMSSFSVELVDAYDENNAVEVNWFNYSNPVVSNILVNCNGVSRGCMYEGAANQFGLSRVEYGTISYLSNFIGEFSWIQSGGEPAHDPFHFSFDPAENQVLIRRLGVPDMSERVILDVDDPAHMGSEDSCFRGFTTGEVYVRFTFEAIARKGGIVLTSVGGKDLSSADLKAGANPVIRTDVEHPAYRTALPEGKKGVAYPVPRAFDRDVVMGKLNVGTMVLAPSGKSTMIWKDTVFVPDETGEHEVVYVAKDMGGHSVIKRMPFEIKESLADIVLTPSLNAGESLTAGEWASLPVARADGGSGVKAVSCAYTFGGRSIEPDASGGFAFGSAGTLVLTATATDYLGTEESETFSYEVGGANVISLFSPLPEVMFAGEEVILPDFTARSLRTGEELQKTIKVNGSALAADRKFTLPQSGDLTVEYIGGSGADAVKQTYTVAVVPFDNANIDMAGLFRSDGAAIEHAANGVRMTAGEGEGMTFANPLSALFAEMHFLLPENPAYEYAEIVLTDALFPDTQIAFRVGTDATTADNFRLQDASGGFDRYKFPLSYKLAAGELLHFFYDNETRTVYNANQIAVATVRYDTRGRVFAGFPSGTMRLTVRAAEAKGDAVLTVAKLGNQPFAKASLEMGDLFAPQLAPTAPVVSGDVPRGTEFLLPSAVALDVLRYSSSVGVTFTDPDGNKLLNNADTSTDRTFTLDKPGIYRLSFAMWDGVNTTERSYLITTVDAVAPTLSVQGGYEEDYAQGTQLTLAGATATDDVSGEGNIRIWVIVKRPDYADIRLKPGDKFTLDKKGQYKITYCAVDEAGNYAFSHFETVVY